MIVKRVWMETRGGAEYRREGWYLFGIVPLYLRDMTASRRVSVRK